VAELLNTVFEDWEDHVCVARNGPEGLNMAMNHTVGEILLDGHMHMPLINGGTMLDE